MTTGSLVGSILLPIAGLLLECFQELLETFKDAQGAPHRLRARRRESDGKETASSLLDVHMPNRRARTTTTEPAKHLARYL